MYLVEWWGHVTSPCFFLVLIFTSGMWVFHPVRLNFCALVDEISTRDSAGSGFKLCDPFLSVLIKRVSHVFSAYISF